MAATFFSVAFAATVAVWLYSWQTGKVSAERRNELRAAQIVGIFDMWDLLRDDNLQTVPLPDGSEAKVLLTFLQPTIYEESVRSGLFGASEAMVMSRLMTIMHIYNNSTQRVPPLTKAVGSAEGESASETLAEELRSEIDTVLENREKVVEAGKNLLNLWTLKEIRTAFAIANPDERENPDPRIAKLIEDHSPKVLPPSYRAGLAANLDKVKEAAEAGDTETAQRLLDEVLEETGELRDGGSVTGDFDGMIASVLEVKEALDEEAAEGSRQDE